jgi:hypothetical protein
MSAMTNSGISGVVVAPGAAGGALAFTGAVDIGWLLVAATTLIAAGLALLRMMPRLRLARPRD